MQLLNGTDSPLPQFDDAMIATLLRGAIASDTAELLSWHYEPIGVPTGRMTGGVYRLSGTIGQEGGEKEWSLVLKIIASPESDPSSAFHDVAHALYWKREVLAFQSGLMDSLPGGLEAPRCFACEEQSDGSYWLWLEDVQESYGPRWPLDQYGRAARKLGRFNGAYLAGEPAPGYPWLVRSASPRGILRNTWIRDIVEDPTTWEDPLLRTAFPRPIAQRLLRLWADREVLLTALDRLPHTFCHLDAWRGNLFAPLSASGEHRLVAIDWAFPGRGVVGTDAGDLFAPGIGMLRVEPTSPAVLDATVFENYLEGLREAGWPGDRNVVRFAFAAFAALKYGCYIPWLKDVQDIERRQFWERHAGAPFAEFLHNQAIMLHYLLDLADEARALLGEGGW